MSNLTWWAYRHVNGGIHVKRAYPGKRDLGHEDALHSHFVAEVSPMFMAPTRGAAVMVAKGLLSPMSDSLHEEDIEVDRLNQGGWGQ